MSDLTWTYDLSDGPSGTINLTTSSTPYDGTLYLVTGASGTIDGAAITGLVSPDGYQGNTNILDSAYQSTGYIDGSNSVAFVNADGTDYVFQYNPGFSDPEMGTQPPFFMVSWSPWGSWSSEPSATFSSTVCYLRGTRILAERGEVPVEDLRQGDRVATRFNGFQPIRWIGTQRFHGRLAGARGAPVRIRAGALGDNAPHSDLLVSPAHAMLIDGHLVAASLLVNDLTITQPAPPDAIEYFHLDLGHHDCVLAEGAWGETYWENAGNRADFHNADSHRAGFPDHIPTEQATCLPYVNAGGDPRLPALRARVTPRLTAAHLSADADVHMMADGARLSALRIGENTWQFVVPAKTRSLRLRSRATRPSMIKASPDHRPLGLCLYAIETDGPAGKHPIALDHPALQQGLHAIERDDSRIWRWTDGNATLPTRLLGDLLTPVTVTIRARHLPMHFVGAASAAETEMVPAKTTG